MKKWMIALVVGMMCLSLCACGSSEADAKYEKYKTLSTNAIYYSANDFTVLELTADNIMDYVEVVKNIDVSKNSFGEVTNVSVYRYLALKEELGVVNSDLSHVAVEYSYDNIRQMVTVDDDAKTYEMGEVTYEYGTSTNTTQMNSQYPDDVRRYGLYWGAFSVDEFPQDEVQYHANYKIERLLGTVYCANK